LSCVKSIYNCQLQHTPSPPKKAGHSASSTYNPSTQDRGAEGQRAEGQRGRGAEGQRGSRIIYHFEASLVFTHRPCVVLLSFCFVLFCFRKKEEKS